MPGVESAKVGEHGKIPKAFIIPSFHLSHVPFLTQMRYVTVIFSGSRKFFLFKAPMIESIRGITNGKAGVDLSAS